MRIIFLVIFFTVFYTKTLWASCSGQSGDHLKKCQAAERSMNNNAMQTFEESKHTIITIKTGKNQKKVTLNELGSMGGDECSFIQRTGPFEIYYSNKKLLSRGSCQCCRHNDDFGNSEKSWGLHGKYTTLHGASENIKEYWCGYEKSEKLNQLIKKSTPEKSCK